ncbi:alginate lyase family protein [Pseudoprimorskyibacter insulae]|uniref:Alginate lyase n=1 Tax=Pseudoprimorskyibacter insulae TaxID=1695997 RepID=A0A2R8APN5_9RHOB|nr:alginate lyase family protein [Pseudoprimorskyibacter insulae]SPF77993.1 Alginate lyase [Pseudoprimorskyibacter insulae]
MTTRNLVRCLAWVLGTAPLLLSTTAMAQDCPATPDPVFTLDYGSRYADDSVNRSDLDAAKSAEVDEALGPVDDFLRDLTNIANGVYLPDADQGAVADCVLGQVADWATVGALAHLQSGNAKMTIGSRLASLGLIVLQAAPFRTTDRDLDAIRPWLADLMQRQMMYWEADAPDGAKRGNLRAWAALGGAAAAAILEDPVVRGWSAWSATYVLCTAEEDGSLPQEMSRGRYALHYQMHAAAPLSVAAALLYRQGVDIRDRCDDALGRVVGFIKSDIYDGKITEAKVGEPQSYFDGTDTLEGFHLAWIEAYLTIANDPNLDTLAEPYRPMSYSKLGGNQTLMWAKQ